MKCDKECNDECQRNLRAYTEGWKVMENFTSELGHELSLNDWLQSGERKGCENTEKIEKCKEERSKKISLSQKIGRVEFNSEICRAKMRQYKRKLFYG